MRWVTTGALLVHDIDYSTVAENAAPPDLAATVSRLLQVETRQQQGETLTFQGVIREDAAEHLDEVRRLLHPRQLGLWVAPTGGRAAVLVGPLDETHRSNRLWNFLLLAATLATTTWAGAFHLGIDLRAQPGRWTAGAPYALALLTILGIHELGHYFTARRRGIQVSLPYFIPAPGYLGTFGSFIRMQGIVRDRAAYFDVAIAGPLAGFVAALIALVIGLRGDATAPHGGVVPASSALFAGVYSLVAGGSLRESVVLGPLAFAGYLGLVVTALNLAPIGQLDGGHIAYALLGRRRAEVLATTIIALMAIVGVLYAPHWLMWAGIAWLIAGRSHPAALDEARLVGAGRVLLGGLALFILVAIVLPWPT